jgi:hypothetical protein
VDGISDVAECGHALLVVRVYESFFMYRIESGWVWFVCTSEFLNYVSLRTLNLALL